MVEAFLRGHLAALAAIEADPGGGQGRRQRRDRGDHDPAARRRGARRGAGRTSPSPPTRSRRRWPSSAADAEARRAPRPRRPRRPRASTTSTILNALLAEAGEDEVAGLVSDDAGGSTRSRPSAARCPGGAAVPGSPAVRIDGVSKVYGHGDGAVAALDRISLDVAAGEFVCLVGASGCGKSTLLNLVADLDQPTGGRRRRAGAGSASCSRRRRCSRGSPCSATSSWRCGCGASSKAERRERAEQLLQAPSTSTASPTSAPRALRRHAPAGRHRPGLRPGRRRAADGRAVRRPRRHDPRPPARRARAAVARPHLHACCSSPTTCARRSASATGSCCSRPGRAGSSRSSRSTSTGPAASRRPRCQRARRRDHRPAARGGPPPCPLTSASAAGERLDDAYRRASTPSTSVGEPRPSARPAHRGRATWPKLLAIALALLRAGSRRVVAWKAEYAARPADRGVRRAVAAARHDGTAHDGAAHHAAAGRRPASPSPSSSACSSASPSPSRRSCAAASAR